jgi:hypothetical protein
MVIRFMYQLHLYIKYLIHLKLFYTSTFDLLKIEVLTKIITKKLIIFLYVIG